MARKQTFTAIQIACMKKEVIRIITDTNENQERAFELVKMIIANACERVKNTGKRFTLSTFETWTGIHITLQHTGKMDGKKSLSTSKMRNKACNGRCNIDGGICKGCYVTSVWERYGDLPKMEKPFAYNTFVLTNFLLPIEIMPAIYDSTFRLEAFGDLNNDTQAKNYFTLAYANKDTFFALWSKNPGYIAKAIKNGYSKPENMNLIFSVFMIDNVHEITFERVHAVFPFIDKIFVVYRNAETAKAHDQRVNCGAKHCGSCGTCYTVNGINTVNELLK